MLLQLLPVVVVVLLQEEQQEYEEEEVIQSSSSSSSALVFAALNGLHKQTNKHVHKRNRERCVECLRRKVDFGRRKISIFSTHVLCMTYRRPPIIDRLFAFLTD